MAVENRVREPVRLTCTLVCQSHDAGHQGTRKARSSEAVFGVFHRAVGEGLGLPDQIAGVRVGVGGDVWYSPAGTALSREHR